MPKTANAFRVAALPGDGRHRRAGGRRPPGLRPREADRDARRAAPSSIPSRAPRPPSATPPSASSSLEQAGPLDAVIVPIGGGGLCAGVAAAVKLAEPADPGLRRGARRGRLHAPQLRPRARPRRSTRCATIADSLGAPYAAPYSFGLCRRYVDDVVLVSDDALRRAMKLLFVSAKLAVEPAGAAATAALLGPLRERLRTGGWA